MAILAVSLFLPQAEAQTTSLRYSDVTTTPLQPLTFIQDSYGNIHVSSSDTYVWRVLRCVAPASGYDSYLSTGVVLMPFDDYDHVTWYTENLGATDGFSSMSVIDRSLLRGDSMGLFVKFTPVSSNDYVNVNALRVYYLSSAGDALTGSNIVLDLDLDNSLVGQFPARYRDGDFDPTTDIIFVNLDTTLLESRGYLAVLISHEGKDTGSHVNDPGGRFYIYSGLPGTTGFTTFAHHPTTYLATGIPSTTIPPVEIGDLITGGNLGSGSTDAKFIGRNPGTGPDMFRSAISGTVDDIDVTYRPLTFVPYTPYYHEGSAGIGRQTFTIPYYEFCLLYTSPSPRD